MLSDGEVPDILLKPWGQAGRRLAKYPETPSEELMDVLTLQLMVATFRTVQAPLEGLHLPWLGHRVA